MTTMEAMQNGKIRWAIAADALCISVQQRGRPVSLVLETPDVDALICVLATARARMEPRLTSWRLDAMLRGLQQRALAEE